MVKVLFSVLSGMLGTMVMMVVMMIVPLIGLPKMSQPDIISAILEVEEYVGWGIYFGFGAVFAVVYHFLFAHRLPINSDAVKGLIFGFMVFVVAQAGVFLLPIAGFTVPKPEGHPIAIATVSLLGHVLYGIMVAIISHDAEVEDEEEVATAENEA